MLGLAEATPPRRRRPGLTPMIDVVFLLLVFFMLAARFGLPGAVDVSSAGVGGAYQGPPRLVSVGADGPRLNGQPIALAALAQALTPLMQTPDDLVILRPEDGAPVQALVTTLLALRDAGLTRLAVIP